jgi:hypothetical protein
MISAKPMRWLVNNGSQIVGPLGAKEIAGRLFEQELDFDCECWVDGTGKSAQIGSAGIFSGSEDEGAVLWVFDGETIHGPISPGFLKTAVACGAISENSFICENSTVNGWKTLQAWNSAIQPAAPLPVEKERPAPSLVSVTPAAEARNDYGAARIGIGEPAGPLSAAHAQPVTETKVPVADLVSEVHDAPVMSPQTPPVVPPPPPAALLRKPAADAPAPAAVTSPSEDDSAKAA